MHSTARDVSLVETTSHVSSRRRRREGHVGVLVRLNVHVDFDGQGHPPASKLGPLGSTRLYEGQYHRPAGTRIRDAIVLSTATGNPCPAGTLTG